MKNLICLREYVLDNEKEVKEFITKSPRDSKYLYSQMSTGKWCLKFYFRKED